MFRNISIGTRLLLFIVLGVGLVLGAITVADYYAANRIMEGELREKAGNLAQATAGEMEVVKRAVEKVVEEVAIVLERGDYSREEIYDLLQRTVMAHSELYGMAVAVQPDASREEVFLPYVYRKDEGLKSKNLIAQDYPYQTSDWYVLPTQLQRPCWTEPYYGSGGEAVMVTYCVPLPVDFPGDFRGVVVGDVALDWLTGLLESLDLGGSGYAFLVSSSGAIVAHPQKELILHESIFSIAQEQDSPALRRLGQDMIHGHSGFVPFHSMVSGGDYYMAYTPVLGTGWSLATLFPTQEIMGKVWQLAQTKLTFGLAGLAALLLLSLLISRSISVPIRALEQATGELADGRLDAELPRRRGNDELAQLTRSFGRMRDDLRNHIDELQRTTAERERINTDLRIAREIQLGLVPRNFTFTPPRTDCEVFALLEPAREVGGDFYDFFLLDENRLAVIIADASGKGAPAALFMAVSRAYLRAFLQENNDPAVALTRLNNELAEGNDTCMFVTVFCGILDLRDGRVLFANGGHHPPLMVRQAGGVQPLPTVKGPVVGPLEDRTFERGQGQLAPGDALVLFTDGVVEAESPAGEFYETDRLVQLLQQNAGQDCRQLVRTIRQDVQVFVGDAPQSDDITVLVVGYNGP